MNESTRVAKTNSKRILVALILIAVVAVAGGAYLYAGPPRSAPTATPSEKVRRDLAFREGAVAVGFTFLWALQL